MKKLLNIKNIALVLLIAIVVFQQCGGNKKGTGEIVKVDGKKYELIKHEIDTIEVVKTKVVTKKGEDIYHETIVEHEVRVPVNVDTNAILKEYYTKVLYKDVLVLPDSLGTVAVTDTISQNKIFGRTFNANVKQRTIKETTIVKELPKNQVYFGFGGQFNKTDLITGLSTGVILKTKKDKIYQVNLGVSNSTIDGVNGEFKPYVGAGVYWKIRLKK
jgi:hypothetical protein